MDAPQAAPSPRYWILTACRNEEPILRLFLTELRETLGAVGLLGRTTLCVVDDLSYDGSAELMAGADAEDLRVLLVRAPTNLGNQGAMFLGLQAVRAGPEDVLITLDCDGEDDVRTLPSIIEAARGAPGQVVMIERGSRRESIVFKLAFAIYKQMFRRLSGRQVVPNNFMLIPGRFVPAFQRSPLAAVHFAYALQRLNPPHVAVVRDRRTRYGGKTSQNLFMLVSHGLVGLMLFYELVVARLFLLVFLFLVAAALVLGLSVAVEHPSVQRLLPWCTAALCCGALAALGLLVAAALALFLKLSSFWLAARQEVERLRA